MRSNRHMNIHILIKKRFHSNNYSLHVAIPLIREHHPILITSNDESVNSEMKYSEALDVLIDF